MRLALAQINSVVGDVDGNAAKVVEWTERARGESADPLPAIDAPAADAALAAAQGKVISAALSINALPPGNDPVPPDMVDARASALFGVDDQWTRIERLSRAPNPGGNIQLQSRVTSAL